MRTRRTFFGVLFTIVLCLTLVMPVSADITPPELIAELAPGESISETKLVTIPPKPPQADVVFAFDLTGSMGGIISTAKMQALNIIAALDALGVDIQYGVMSYMDYPHIYDTCDYYATYGDSFYGDYAYSLDQSVIDDSLAVASAINGLVLGWGGDGPQDYTRIMYESYADPNVGWRSGARRILVNFGDNVPHDCNLNEGVASWVWSTGCDPGRDEIAGTSDDLDLQTVLAEMADNGVILLEAHTTSAYSTNWDYWTGLTDGGLYVTGSSTLINDITSAVEDALTTPVISDLHLETSLGFESWLTSVIPASYATVAPGDIVSFDITITVPEGTPDGVYNFTINAVDDVGVSYGEQDVSITVINLPPIADPNGPYLGAVIELIVFDGTDSWDPEGDPLTYDWTFGDGNTGTGAMPSHAYTEAGIFDVCLTVSDGYTPVTACTTAVVYDPSAGFVTGGGWIDSPAGAYTKDPSLFGQATFGFVSKYHKGATVPDGETQFIFHAGDFHFHSSSYEWLVINKGDARAQFKGVGGVDIYGAPREGNFQFMLWATDGDLLDPSVPDTFRIKIWVEDSEGEQVLYDNGVDQDLGSGSIIIHTAKK